MDSNHGSDPKALGKVISGGAVPQGGGGRRSRAGLLVVVVVVLVVGGFAFSRGYGTRSVSPPTDLPVVVAPSTSSTTTSSVTTAPVSVTAIEPSGPIDPIDFDWMNEVVDLAAGPDGLVYAVAPVGLAMLDQAGEWTLLDVEELPVGIGLDSRLSDWNLTHIATGPDGTVWVAGLAVSHADDEQFGGIIDGWSGGRILWWVARYHCAVCGEWTVWTTNEVPALGGGIGDLVVSGDGTVYASVAGNRLLVFDGSGWESHVLPTGWVWAGDPWSDSMTVASDGVLWAASPDAGLVAFDGTGFTQYTSADGVPSDTVVQVTTGVDGTIWVATDAPDDDPSPDAAAGVAVFDGTTWTSYTMADGLLSNNAVIATGPDGTVWAVHSEDPPFGYSRFDGTRWTANQFGLPVGDRQAVATADGTLWTLDNEVAISFDGTTRTIRPSPFVQPVGFFTFSPVRWGIILDDPDRDPGIHTVLMIADARPVTVDLVEDVSGRLIWDETVVDLCGIGIRREGDGFLHIGDIFQTSEGCGNNPTAMQDAFDEFGLPETACVTVRFGDVDHEYCAPLSWATSPRFGT